MRILALGDSLTAGYGLPAAAAFPNALERALRAKGLDVSVVNAGVSGDTAGDGLDRLDWALGDAPPDAAIVEFGGNDMLRGLDPAKTRDALEKIIATLQARGVKVLIAGMLAAPNLGADYAGRFNAIFPSLAKQFGAPLYPFFLQDVAGVPALGLGDGLHPNAAGVETVVRGVLPDVEALVASVRPKG